MGLLSEGVVAWWVAVKGNCGVGGCNLKELRCGGVTV